MKKIVLIGPESTGKTSLAKALALHFKEAWVPEYARKYIAELGRNYIEADLLAIAKGQLKLEDSFAKRANNYLFCDTNLIVIKIWANYKYGKCHPWILQQIKQRSYDFYFLCGTDVPWEYDLQRENPNNRAALYALYKAELLQMNCPFVELRGSLPERLEEVKSSLALLK